MKGTKMKTNQIIAYGRKKNEIQKIGTYEVEYNEQLRGQESEAFPTIY